MLFQFFHGNWQIDRNYNTGESFSGIVVFTTYLPNTILKYSEKGIFINQKRQKFEGFRIYYYKITKYDLSIFFDHSTYDLFQSFDFSKDLPTKDNSKHICKKDSYNTEFKIIDTMTFQISHRVQGPHKNYQSKATYQKIPN